MNTKHIAVLAGDGIGPEIMNEALKVLEVVAKKYDFNYELHPAVTGACAIDQCGDPYPETTHQICEQADAILFGAIGHPKYDLDPTAKVRPEQGLLRMRSKLGLFANLRPVKPFEALYDLSPLKREKIEGVDLIIFRELTGGLYFGEPRGRNEERTKAWDTCLYDENEISRIAHAAFKASLQRRKIVTLVDKANVLETSRLWREVVEKIYKSEYEAQGVTLKYLFVDNAAMQLVTNPAGFDIMLTENLFGDILSDEASVLCGSIGLLPSASMGAGVSLYEPIHGSFPEGAGKGIANPIAMILSLAMMFEHSFNMPQASLDIQAACLKVIETGYLTPDLAASEDKVITTSEIGDRICSAL